MCKCGCGTCETKITGPLLTESKVKSLLSEGLNHHISNAIPLHETVYRYGSEKHLALIKEARKLYSRHVIDLNEHDVELVKTHLGEWGLFEGESVPLDLPMMNEEYSTLDLHNIARRLKNQGFITKIKPSRFDKGIYDVTYFAGDIDDLQLALNDIFGRDNYRISFDENISEETTMQGNPNLRMGTYAGRPVVVNTMGTEDMTKWKATFLNTGKRVDFADVIANIKFNEDLDENIDKVAGGIPYKIEGNKAIISTPLPDDAKERIIKRAKENGYSAKPNMGGGVTIFKEAQLDEKKKSTKKDPPIGKPKRGGSKAYYVYVRDPKTKKIKKVSFGSGGLRAKINNPKARQAFAARHRCKEKNDRTKPSYWSCRLPRYVKALGLGNNKNTFW